MSTFTLVNFSFLFRPVQKRPTAFDQNGTLNRIVKTNRNVTKLHPIESYVKTPHHIEVPRHIDMKQSLTNYKFRQNETAHQIVTKTNIENDRQRNETYIAS